MNFEPEAMVQLANKYLDRVELKGLREFHEFGHLVAFFAAISSGEVKINRTKETPDESQ